MKIIEALKLVKMNKQKIADLQGKISQHCATLSHETAMYGDGQKTQVEAWLQSCRDLSQDNIALLVRIQKTNIDTNVTIEIGGKHVTKTIAEWVWRRREYADLDKQTYAKLTDRGLKEGVLPSSVAGQPGVEIKLVRHYDPVQRDEKIAEFTSERFLIDSALEITNAITDLVE